MLLFKDRVHPIWIWSIDQIKQLKCQCITDIFNDCFALMHFTLHITLNVALCHPDQVIKFARGWYFTTVSFCHFGTFAKHYVFHAKQAS